MIRNILDILWNCRRKYALIFVEQAVVFAIVLICLAETVSAVRQYRSPGILETDNVVYFGYMMHGNMDTGGIVSTMKAMDAVVSDLKTEPYVEDISESVQMLPYTRPAEYFWTDSVRLSSGKKHEVHIKAADEAAANVLRPDLVDGRWFRDRERPGGRYPAVVTVQFSELAGMDSPVGKTFSLHGRTYCITGVVSGLKEDPLKDSEACVVVPVESWNPLGYYREFAARVKPGSEDDFATEYYNAFGRIGGMSENADPFLNMATRDKMMSMSGTFTRLVAISVPTAFLLVFMFLGVAGSALMDARSRKREFALKRAVGATVSDTVMSVFVQNFLVGAVSFLPGFIVGLSVYGLTPVFLAAAGITGAVVVVLVVGGTVYPAVTVSNISPAEILRDE